MPRRKWLMPLYGFPVWSEMGVFAARTQSARQGAVPCSSSEMILSVTTSKTVPPFAFGPTAAERGGSGMSPAWRGAGAGTGPGRRRVQGVVEVEGLEFVLGWLLILEPLRLELGRPKASDLAPRTGRTLRRRRSRRAGREP